VTNSDLRPLCSAGELLFPSDIYVVVQQRCAPKLEFCFGESPKIKSSSFRVNIADVTKPAILPRSPNMLFSSDLGECEFCDPPKEPKRRKSLIDDRRLR